MPLNLYYSIVYENDSLAQLVRALHFYIGRKPIEKIEIHSKKEH